MMDGKLEVKSEGLGKGSEFSFSVFMPPAPSTSLPISQIECDGEGRKVLIYSTSTGLVGFLRDAMEKWNYKCFPVSYKDELKEVTEREKIDIVLIDENLLGEICNYVSNVELVLMGYTIRTEKRYLRKPIRKRNLLRLLLEMTNQKCLAFEDEIEVPKIPTLERDLRILIADDNLCNCRVLQILLTRMNLRNVDIVHDGIPAVEAVKQKKYDVLFLDMMMPGMLGTEVARIIKNEIPIEMRPVMIGVTANAFENERNEFLDAGAVSVLTKPFDLSSIAETLMEFC